MTSPTNQEKYLELKVLQEQIEKITQHVEFLSTQFAEIENSKEALEELSKQQVGSELLAPIANGIFVKSSLKDTKTLLVNVGADTVVEKTIPQVIELLDNQAEQISQKLEEVQTFLEEMQDHAIRTYKQLQEEE